MKNKNTVVLSRQAEHFFKKSDPKNKAQIRDCLIGLEVQAYGGKPLHGDLRGSFSLRVGKKIRVIYRVSEQEKIVYVTAIGPRRNVYEQ